MTGRLGECIGRVTQNGTRDQLVEVIDALWGGYKSEINIIHAMALEAREAEAELESLRLQASREMVSGNAGTVTIKSMEVEP